MSIDRVDTDSFARWALGEINSNIKRALLGEYVVHLALQTQSLLHTEWDSHDVTYRGKRIEVKTSGYVSPPFIHTQSPPVPKFDIAKRTHAWSNEVGDWVYQGEAVRHSDMFVFAVTTPRTKDDFDAHDLGKWVFIPAPTAAIDALFSNQKSVTIGRLDKHFERSSFWSLKSTVDRLIEEKLYV